MMDGVEEINNILSFHELVTLDGDNNLVTDTLKVAAVHGKRHDNVLNLTRKRIEEAGEWGLLNFKEGVYYDPRNQQNHPMFTMTKDGYAFLVGKMSGKKAVEHQIAYITAFNAMADFLARHDKNLWQKMQELIAQEVESKVKASFGSHLMLTRKKEIPGFREKRELLESQIQPSLFIN